MRWRLILGLSAVLLYAGPGVPGRALGPALLVTDTVWRGQGADWGGISAIEVAPDGRAFTILTDKGHIAEGRFERDGADQITGWQIGPLRALKGRTEAPLAKGRNDSEGLVLLPGGSGAYVSFEGVARVLFYPDLSGPAENLPRPEAFARMRRNGAFEALALAPDGALYALTEEVPRGKAEREVWRFQNGAWQLVYTLEGEGPFRPVAADFGPDGRLYLLERAFQGLGFASRLRRFTLPPAGSAPRSLGPGEPLLESAYGQHDNLEGLAVWQDRAGALRLTLVADDNFRFFQRSELVEYRLPR
jgi:hypothetical protein